MNYSEVTKLLDAGFTVDEIRGMMGSNPQNPQDNPQPEPEQPEQQPEPDTASQPVTQPTPEQEEKFSQLSQSIEKLIKTIQVSNLQNRSFDTPATPDINKQVDSIMAGIIRPEHENNKEV
jgi:DNA-binding transcriptional MerR regulator